MKRIIKVFFIIVSIVLIGGAVFGISISGIWLYSVILLKNGNNHPERAAMIYQQINRSNEYVPWGISFHTYLKDQIEMLEVAGEAGYDDAMYLLGEHYMGYQYRPNRDIERATYWLFKSAEKENVSAKAEVGILYLYGIGVEQNLSKAISNLQAAADNGHEKAQLILGDLYSYGAKWIRNETTKLWYFYDGLMYDDKSKLYWYIQDPNEKVDRFQHICLTKPNKGDELYHLFKNFGCLLSPEGIQNAKWGEEIICLEPDLEKAKYYWKKAADQGSEGAKEQLQRIYIKGIINKK